MEASGIDVVFRTLREHDVQSLLCGGQACVIYGAAEFSKDVDFVVVADAKNFDRLKNAAASLQATVIAVPAFEKQYLDEGLAIHLRCHLPTCEGLRVDVMSKMRGMDSFDQLWQRRTLVEVGDLQLDILSVADLITSKKTQRAKDWPMIQRLAEVYYQQHRSQPSAESMSLCLRELRTPELLIEVAAQHRPQAEQLIAERPLLRIAIERNESDLRRALLDEEVAEKERDRLYWQPLKVRLGELRRTAKREDE